jgi:cytochrome P450
MRAMALPPGPRWPVVFQTIAFLHSGHPWIERASKRFGDLFTIRTLIYGTQVLTSDPAIIKQVFTGDPDVFHVGVASTSPVGGDRSVLVVDGEPHRRLRRLLMPPFHGERMQAYAEAMRSITERVVAGWKVGQPFSLFPSMQRITLDVILANVFGLPEGPRRDLFADRLKTLIELFVSPLGPFFLIPALQRDLGPLYPWRRLKAQFDSNEALMYEEIAGRRARLAQPGAERPDDILSLLLDVRDEDGQGMPDQEIRDQLSAILAAGYETTASSLAWAFERILAHPAVYDRLIAEIDQATAQGKTAAADLSQLEYLDATIKEVLRQRSSVPMLIRRVTRPTIVRDYELPAGAVISASVYLTHRRPDLYPEPDAFQPERFLGKKIDPYIYLPFGGGARRCLGAAFALQELKVVVATVLKKLRLKLVKTPPLKIAPRSIFLAPEGGTEVVLLGERN